MTSETQTIGQTSTVINYTYDANGNLIKKKEGTKSTTYAFDVWGNMISAAGASYTYNAQGLRISKTVNKKKTSFTLINGKVWSDGTYNYVWGMELITNGSVYYLYNAHGDVVQLVNASGTVTKTYDYEAYGNELTRDAADPNPFRYCGEYYDNETGFIYLRARYYDPSVGRFISKDPHWNVKNMIYGDNPAKDNPRPDTNAIKQSGNLYLYCADNPVCFVDKDGCKLKWPGEIHHAVQNRIVNRMALQGTIIYTEVGIESNGKYIGRADLVQDNGKNAYIWEVKPNKPKHIKNGMKQLERYINGDYLNASIRELRELKSGYDISEEMFTYHGVFNDFIVTYRSVGNGIITYDYTAVEKKKSEVKVEDAVAVTAVVVLIALGVLLTANGVPVFLFV